MRAMKRPVAPPERSAGLRAHPHQLAVSAQTLRVACVRCNGAAVAAPSGTPPPADACRRELPSRTGGAECTSRSAGRFPLKQENIPMGTVADPRPAGRGRRAAR